MTPSYVKLLMSSTGTRGTRATLRKLSCFATPVFSHRALNWKLLLLLPLVFSSSHE